MYGLSSVLRTIKRASDYRISDSIINRLNYYDLQSLIIEYDIETIESEIKRKEHDRLESLGLERTEASNSDLLKMHGIGGD